MPFPKDVVAQLDYNSRLRLTICFFRMKTMLKPEEDEHPPTAGLDDPLPSKGCEQGGGGRRRRRRRRRKDGRSGSRKEYAGG